MDYFYNKNPYMEYDLPHDWNPFMKNYPYNNKYLPHEWKSCENHLVEDKDSFHYGTAESFICENCGIKIAKKYNGDVIYIRHGIIIIDKAKNENSNTFPWCMTPTCNLILMSEFISEDEMLF